MNKKWIKGIALASASLLLAACSGGSGSSQSSGGDSGASVLQLPAGAEIPEMDSTLVTDTEGFVALGNTQDGLYRQSQDSKGYDLALAAEEPTVSEDGKTLTFKLRETKWSNGDPLKAQDFVYSWQRLVDPENAASYAYLMEGVVENASEIIAGEKKPEELGVKALDDSTLEVKLVNHVPYLNSLLAMAPFYPLNEAYVEEQGDQYGSDSDHLIYIGPYTLTGWDGTGLSWTYKKNPDYWDAEAVKTDQIDIQVIKEVSTGLNLYDADELDRLALTGDYISQRANDPDLVKEPESTLFYLKYNFEKGPLQNASIRKALSMAVDRQAYVDRVLQNGSVVATGLVPANLSASPADKTDFREQSGDLSVFNKDEAKTLFEQGLKELGVDSLELELVSDDSENAKKSSEFIQAQLQENLPNLSVTLTNVPFKVRLQKDTNREYDIILSGWGADFPDPINFLELFETGNGYNRSKYSNEKFDELIQFARSETEDLNARWEALIQAEKILVEEDSAIGPLYQRYKTALNKQDLKGWVSHSVGMTYDYKWLHK